MQKHRFVRLLKDLGQEDLSLAGGKGANLGEMIRTGLPVPEGFVVLVDAYRKFVAENKLEKEIATLLSIAANGQSEHLNEAAERDYITEGHARRLEDLCWAVGEKTSLSSHQRTDLALLAQVHDLGKVGIPDQILFKPGPLNEEEWVIMRGHPEKGYRIASSSPDLASVAELILKHHERWDGSGYPLGLKETEIPVECRIMAIVDAYDAMTNKRPYNTVKSPEETVKELKENAGSQFDPELVLVFLSVLEEQNHLSTPE